MMVWIYVDTAKEVQDPEHIKVFATVDAAEKWFEENDPEGVAFEYEIWNEPDRAATGFSKRRGPSRWQAIAGAVKV
jgi:hypothetical protein